LGAKLIAISSGGLLGSYARKYKAPFYEISYGSAPRVSLGYFVSALYKISMRLGLIEKNQDVMLEASVLVKGFLQKIKSDVVLSKNSSKQLALRLKGKIPVMVGNDALLPAAMRFSTQINESALTMSFYQSLSELRHHSIRGINFPAKLQEKVIFILFSSRISGQKDEERFLEITRLFDRRGLPYETIAIDPPGSKLAEALCAIQLADYTAYYLSILYDNNPQQEDEL
jgi:glucose/mannose-6-phosphate isomerase